jgi:hypothetical protein
MSKPKITDINTDALWENVESIEQVEALVYEYLNQILEDKDCDINKRSLKRVVNYIEENF